MSKRLIARQRARTLLLEAFPETAHRSRIRDYLFSRFGDVFQPSVGEVVAAWNSNEPSIVTYGRYESGGNNDFMVDGVNYDRIRDLVPEELN